MKKIILVILALFLLSMGVEFVLAQTDEASGPRQMPFKTVEPQRAELTPSGADTTETESGEPAEAEGADKTPQSMEEGMAKRISLDLRGMDILDTIKFLSMKGNLNIVTSKNVSGRITLFLKDVTIADTLDVILLTNKLAKITRNNITTIMTEAEYGELYGEKYIDKRELKTIKIKYAKPSSIGAALESLKSSIGKIIMDDATGTMILIDTPEKIAEMEETAHNLDKGLVEKEKFTTTKIFELEYATVSDIEGKVSDLITPDIGSIASDERTNRIIVNDLPPRLKEIEEMITAFDRKTREVIIEAKIVEISLSDDFSFGVNWEKIFATTSRDINFIGSFPMSTISGAEGNVGRISVGQWKSGFWSNDQTADQAFTPGTIDSSQTNQILNFLRAVGDVKIVSAPYIAVTNNEEAQIMVGTRQPYATSTISQSETTATTSWSAEFVDLGVTLTVTPTINKDGYVKMHIKPEVSTLTQWFEILDDAGVAQIRLPEVDTSNAETSVLVQDGRTIIIAGLIRDREYTTERRLPVLGDIPLVGRLFGSTATGIVKRELVVFLTPHIISGGEDIFFTEGAEKLRKPMKE